MDWVPDTEDFSARLALIRHHMRWNAKEAALACSIKPQSWREWELSGRRPQDYEGVCRQIAAATGCDLVWLMTGVRPTTTPPPRPPAHPSGGRRPGQLVRQLHPVASEPQSPHLGLVEVNDDAAHYVAMSEDSGKPVGKHFIRRPSRTAEIVALPRHGRGDDRLWLLAS